jgi:hypothetical protein
MGGPGSGNWWRWQGKKDTVEDSLVVGMKELRKRLFAGATGSITWIRTSGGKSSIGYYVTGCTDRPTVHLHYRWLDKENVDIPVRLEAMPTQFGGRRWWFICPLIARGIACNRRAGKLYLPAGAKYFGCRECHDLTYRSSQEAHQTERVFRRLGFDAEVAKLWDRRHRGN